MRAAICLFGMLAAGFLAARSGLAAPNLALDNILVSRTNGVTNIQIWPACRMRYVDHVPSGAGVELRIRVRVDAGCGELLDEVATEVYLPLGRRLGSVSDVRFDKLSGDETFITLRFDAPQRFSVRQHTIGWIEVFVDTEVDSATVPANVLTPLDADRGPAAQAPSLEAAPRRPTPARRAPVRRQAAAGNRGEYVVQLGVFESVERAVAELARTETPYFPYTTEFELNGRTWHGLQLGFFDSEASAELVLSELGSSFPDSWVRHVSPAEAQLARSNGVLEAERSDALPAVSVTRAGSADAGEIAGWMGDGRQAMLERRYADAIANYTRILEYPDHVHRATAREYSGVAHERSGRRDSAVAEYRAYLAEFPDGESAARVESRLTSLLSATARRPVDAVPAGSVRADVWQLYGGISQYYWRNEEQLVHDGNRLIRSSGVLALGDLTASRHGTRFDVLARANGAYQVNLVEFDDTGDIGWLSDAWIDVADKQLGLEARVGRQTRRSDGIIGRFDGAAFRYRWKPDVSFSLSSGFPIDSPRYGTGTERFFVAAGAGMENLWDRLSVNAYTHHQTVDGISDRQAAGGEVRYREGPVNVVGLFDYDLSYKVLNTALVNGSWILESDWRLSGLVRFGAQPYLTTRNALAGQTARSIDELLDIYSEGQVRTLARHRTAEATTFSAGVSIPLAERLRMSLDVTARRSDATEASGGVAALPDTGTRMFYNARLVASSLLRQGDLNILTLRHDSAPSRDSSMVMIDVRLPLGEGLRFNPRVSLVSRTDKLTAMDQTIVSPSIRVVYRWRALMIDLEAGGRWSNRDLPPTEFDPFTVDGTEELVGGYVNVGYRLEF